MSASRRITSRNAGITSLRKLNIMVFGKARKKVSSRADVQAALKRTAGWKFGGHAMTERNAKHIASELESQGYHTRIKFTQTDDPYEEPYEILYKPL